MDYVVKRQSAKNFTKDIAKGKSVGQSSEKFTD